MDKIYAVVGLRKHPQEEDLSPRVFGYYVDEKQAESAIINNKCDLWEAGYYPFVACEVFTPGLHGSSWETKFFEYNMENGLFEEMDLKLDITNFAMG